MITLKNVAVDSSKWMSCPKLNTEYPGLAYISALDQLIVTEKHDALHEIIGKTGIPYTIFNNERQKVFLAVKEKRCRRFNIKIFNNYGNEVIEVKRPFKFCINRALVWAPPGNFVGSVVQARYRCKIYHVTDRHGKVVLKIREEALSSHLIYDSSEKRVGIIKPKWNLKEVLDTKNFGISFPATMDVGDKAVLLGACFLIGSLPCNNMEPTTCV